MRDVQYRLSLYASGYHSLEIFLAYYHWYCPWGYYNFNDYYGNAFEHWYR